jgi:hypothetical protein
LEIVALPVRPVMLGGSRLCWLLLRCGLLGRNVRHRQHSLIDAFRSFADLAICLPLMSSGTLVWATSEVILLWFFFGFGCDAALDLIVWPPRHSWPEFGQDWLVGIVI